MKNFAAKFRLIFIPFLVMSMSSLIIYCLLRWSMFIKANLFTVDEDILDFWAPWVFPWVFILIWLRPRIKLLNLKNKNGSGDPLFGYMMVASFTIAVPIMVSQSYLETATGKLTQLENVNQIRTRPPTKFYKINHFYIDKKLCSYKTRFEVSGKYNQDFDMYIYIAVPIYDSDHIIKRYNFKISSPGSSINSNNALIIVDGKIADKNSLHSLNPRSIADITVLKGSNAQTIYGEMGKNGAILITTKPGRFADTLQSMQEENAKYTPFAWIGVKYQKTISNKLSSDEKQQRYHEFATQSQTTFDSTNLNKFTYLDRINYSRDFKGYINAIKMNPSNALITTSPIVFTTVNEPFEARNGNKLLWIFGSSGIGCAVFLVMLLFKPLKDSADLTDEVAEQKEEDLSTLKELKLFFLPREGFYITPILIDLNILIFIIMALSGLGFLTFSGAELLKWGGNYRPSIDHGEYWRLFTNIFLHGGLLHILFNMYGLFFVGIFLEPKIGSKRYLFAYLVTGIAASISSAWWHPATVSIGASGAIFGMYGVFLALLTINLYPGKSKKAFLINTSIFIGYNLIYGLAGGIDNAAHIGGLLSGLVLGYCLYPFLKDKIRQERADAETEQFLAELNNKPQKEISE